MFIYHAAVWLLECCDAILDYVAVWLLECC